MRWRSAVALTAAAFLGGVIATASILGLWWIRLELDEHEVRGDPGAANWQCDGARVVAFAFVSDGVVNVLVTLSDDEHRVWELMASPDYPARYLKPATAGRYPLLRLADGDLDGGSDRDVSLRVDGTNRWCTGTVALT